MKRFLIAMFVLMLATVGVSYAAKPATYTKPTPGTPDVVSTPKQINVSDFGTLERLNLRPGRLDAEWCGLNYHAKTNAFVYDCVPAGTAIYTNGDVVYKADCGNLLVGVQFDCPDACPGGVHISQDELDRLQEAAATNSAGSGDLLWDVLKVLLILAAILLLILFIGWLGRQLSKLVKRRDRASEAKRAARRACPNQECPNHTRTNFSSSQMNCEWCNSPLMWLTPDGNPIIQHPPASEPDPDDNPEEVTPPAEEPTTDPVEETPASAPTPPVVPVPAEVPPSGQDPEPTGKPNQTKVTFKGTSLKMLRESREMAYSANIGPAALYIFDSSDTDIDVQFNNGEITLTLTPSDEVKLTDL